MFTQRTEGNINTINIAQVNIYNYKIHNRTSHNIHEFRNMIKKDYPFLNKSPKYTFF
jgi:hypothetical protein